MSQQTINTVIVLRNDQTTAWEKSTYKLLKGEVGIGYLDNGNVIAKLGVDGQTEWKDLPQIEGVLEKDLILTYDFGRYTTTNGFVNAGGKGMTTREWLEHALSETKEPVITAPTFALTASGTGAGGEIGTYITALKWDGTTTYGNYEYGPETGLSASDRTWSIKNSIDGSQTATTEDGTFTLTSDKYIQLTQTASKNYATVTGTYTLDVSGANDPYNNVGAKTAGKITGPADNPDKITGEIVANVAATAYRKPFYGVLTPAEVVDTSALTSDIIRGLPQSGTRTKGLPTSISVPAGSQMVIFAALAGQYSSLTATDDKAMNATVTFEKKAKAVRVKGANNFVTSTTGDEANGVEYDVWYVNWGAGIGSAKQLTLKWA